MYDTDSKISQMITERTQDCDRRVIAMREDGAAGIALVGPDSLMMACAWFGGAFITNHHLN